MSNKSTRDYKQTNFRGSFYWNRGRLLPTGQVRFLPSAIITVNCTHYLGTSIYYLDLLKCEWPHPNWTMRGMRLECNSDMSTATWRQRHVDSDMSTATCRQRHVDSDMSTATCRQCQLQCQSQWQCANHCQSQWAWAWLPTNCLTNTHCH